MNTEAIKAYARAMYVANPEDTDAWYSFDDNWDINIYHTEFGADPDQIYVVVYPVVDKQVQTDGGYVYSFVLEV